jgi:hypothetical protein
MDRGLITVRLRFTVLGITFDYNIAHQGARVGWSTMVKAPPPTPLLQRATAIKARFE